MVKSRGVVSRARRGASRLGCLIQLIILGSMIYFGLYVGEDALSYYRFRDAMKQEARFAGHRTDQQIRDHLKAFSDSVLLPDAAKDMTILYDHPYTSFIPPTPPATEPRRKLAYPTLTGFVWSAHWYELAALEPLESFGDPAARDRDLATVAERLKRKLSFGKPPDAFPGELPLAPAIAPGLVALHERAASIIDNLNVMQDVLLDILVRSDVPNLRATVNEVVGEFTNRQFRCVSSDEWIVVALRHSIFEQGGPAVGTMGYERNAFSGGHGQHYAVRRAPPPCSPE